MAGGDKNKLKDSLLSSGVLLARRIRKVRPFDRAECRVCSLKESTYCWRQCPYNVWRQRQIE